MPAIYSNPRPRIFQNHLLLLSLADTSSTDLDGFIPALPARFPSLMALPVVTSQPTASGTPSSALASKQHLSIGVSSLASSSSSSLSLLLLLMYMPSMVEPFHGHGSESRSVEDWQKHVFCLMSLPGNKKPTEHSPRRRRRYLRFWNTSLLLGISSSLRCKTRRDPGVLVKAAVASLGLSPASCKICSNSLDEKCCPLRRLHRDASMVAHSRCSCVHS